MAPNNAYKHENSPYQMESENYRDSNEADDESSSTRRIQRTKKSRWAQSSPTKSTTGSQSLSNRTASTLDVTKSRQIPDEPDFEDLATTPVYMQQIDHAYERNRRRYIDPCAPLRNQVNRLGLNAVESAVGERTVDVVTNAHKMATETLMKWFKLDGPEPPPPRMPLRNIMESHPTRYPRQYMMAEGKWNKPRVDSAEKGCEKSRLPLKGMESGLVEVSDNTEDELEVDEEDPEDYLEAQDRDYIDVDTHTKRIRDLMREERPPVSKPTPATEPPIPARRPKMKACAKLDRKRWLDDDQYRAGYREKDSYTEVEKLHMAIQNQLLADRDDDSDLNVEGGVGYPLEGAIKYKHHVKNIKRNLKDAVAEQAKLDETERLSATRPTDIKVLENRKKFAEKRERMARDLIAQHKAKREAAEDLEMVRKVAEMEAAEEVEMNGLLEKSFHSLYNMSDKEGRCDGARKKE